MPDATPYWFDLDPVREPVVSKPGALSWDRESKEDLVPGKSTKQHRLGRTWDERKSEGAPARRGIEPSAAVGDSDFQPNPKGRNPGDMWSIPTQPFPEAHFAVMAPELARRCVVTGCKPNGVVLDPFSGVGTTGMVAAQTGRRYVGIDLSRRTLDLSLRTRLGQVALLDGGAA